MIHNRNMKKRLGTYIVTHGFIESNPIRYLDIGARGGIPDVFRQIQSGLQVIGCEPDIGECRRLNVYFQSKGLNIKLYPHAIHHSSGKQVFNITRLPFSSGLIAADPKFLQRLSEVNQNNLAVVDRVVLETTTIDQMLLKENITEIDFLKIDTEGSEHCVLQGAMNQLRGPHLLGVESEFWTGPIKMSDNLPVIHKLLTSLGFYLFDINIGRYPRRSFPRGILGKDPDSGEPMTVHPHHCGQILTGDVVYLRDPVWELLQGVDRFRWNDSNVLKMAMIYEHYQLNDCAVELLQTYQSHFSSNLYFEKMFDLLTPEVAEEQCLGYREYVRTSLALPWQEQQIFEPLWQQPRQTVGDRSLPQA